MIEDPPLNPNESSLWGRWARSIKDWIRSITVHSSPTVRATQTIHGTFLEVISSPGVGGSPLPLIDQWVATTSYTAKDFAFCYTNAEFDAGSKCGLYQCIVSIAGDAGNTHPSADATHWKQVAYGHWQKFVYIKGSQKIVFDVGRDGSDKPSIKMWLDKDDATAGSTLLDIKDITDLVVSESIPGGTDLTIKFRVYAAKDTETGACKRCILFGSEFFV